MRLAVVVLVMLGLVAAGAGVLLVNAIRANPEEKTVNALVAQTNLAADTAMEDEHLKLDEVPEKDLPVGYLTNPAQAIGKVLTIEVTEGQTLTASILRPKNRLEDFLEPGMRAISMPCSKIVGSTLLGPGSIVDLHVTFPLRDRKLGQSLVISGLLQQLRVLVVGDDSIVPQTEGKRVTSRSSSRNSELSLEVTDAQASIVQLALGSGTVTLPLRSRSDRKFKKVQPMVWKEGKMVPFGPLLDPEDPAGVMHMLSALPVGQPVAEEAIADPNDPNAVIAVAVPPTQDQGNGADQPDLRHWKVTVHKGNKESQVEGTESEQPTDEGGG